MAKKTIKDDFTLLAILLIPIAIAINFICGNLALALKLPLYLDSIGTYLVGMLAGPWVALVTGFLSITINAVSDPTLFPYALLAGLMGMVVGFFAKKGLFSSVPGMVFSGLVVALCSVVGTVVINTYFSAASAPAACRSWRPRSLPAASRSGLDSLQPRWWGNCRTNLSLCWFRFW